MHAVVMESLEGYLSGTLEPATQREIEAHLCACEMCRQELRGMQEISSLFGSLRTEEVPAPEPGFYARVMQQVERQPKAAPSFASLFGFDLAFGRRLAFASLMTLAVLGGFLASREAEFAGAPSPAAVMAQESAAFEAAPAPDNMLVTLAAYEH